MECIAFEQGRCRSCSLLHVPQQAQLRSKQEKLEALLEPHLGKASPPLVWEQALMSAESGFRAKAKMVAGGSIEQPTLGILAKDFTGVDLMDCMLHDPAIVAALPSLRDFITIAALEPYDVVARRGELKHIIVLASDRGELMVRFVMRSTEAQSRIAKHLPWLQTRLSSLVVASINVLPDHAARLEGEREIMLTRQRALPLTLGRVPLQVLPQSFVQTNTAIASQLYETVARWVSSLTATTVWDLYCGVGGFALHVAAQGRTVVGVETSASAVQSATASAAAMADAGVPGAADVTFVAADATAWAVGRDTPDVVIVNPPRRGIGKELASWLENSDVQWLVYSSCNAVTLAGDLALMPSLRPVRGQLLDMFPHTEHFEAVVLLERA